MSQHDLYFFMKQTNAARITTGVPFESKHDQRRTISDRQGYGHESDVANLLG
jgi:hypothetical protein